MDAKVVFEFKSIKVTAYGRPVSLPPDLFFENVLRLSLEDTDHTNLPPQIILKKERRGHKHLFDNELRVYQHLHRLQGTVIPDYLGLANINDERALVLSDIGGVAMIEKTMPRFDKTELEAMLAIPVRLIRQLGVHLADLSMLNVHFCGDAFRIVDFEDARIVSEKIGDEEAYVRDQTLDLVDSFQKRQEALENMARFRRVKRPRAGARRQVTVPQAVGKLT